MAVKPTMRLLSKLFPGDEVEMASEMADVAEGVWSGEDNCCRKGLDPAAEYIPIKKKRQGAPGASCRFPA